MPLIDFLTQRRWKLLDGLWLLNGIYIKTIIEMDTPYNRYPQELKNKIQLIEDGKPSSDFENVKTIHSALRFIEPRLLAYEGIWVYFTHIYFWQYMQNRWVKDSKVTLETIKDRFFLNASSDRGLLRNGIARLWFLGHVTFDSENDNDH